MPIKFASFDIKGERTWWPTPRQFRVGHNPNYLNSLVVGIGSPILHLPQILWYNSLWPFLKSLAAGLSFIALSMFSGLIGRANGFIVTEIKEREATREEREIALADMLRGTGYKAVPEHYQASDVGGSGQH